MLKINIPGRGEVILENILFDYNGTLAVDGFLDEKTKEKLKNLSHKVNVYILTADTYGTVGKECKDLNIKVETFPKENAGAEKKRIVQKLGKEHSLAVGNGYNDIEMFKESNLSFAVVGAEGSCGKLIMHADAIFNNIFDIFEALENPDRIKATLRN